MPSQLHDVLVQLFRNRPLLAPELLRDALSVEVPKFTETRIDSADLTDVQPIAPTSSCSCSMAGRFSAS